MPDEGTPPIDESEPRLLPISEAELDNPHVGSLLKVVLNGFLRIVRDRPSILIASSFVLLLLWGTHGKVDLLAWAFEGWRPGASTSIPRAEVIPGIPWDQEWISFWIGALLLVVIPAVLVRKVQRLPLRAFGLGPPRPGRGRLTLLSSIFLVVVTLPAFYLGTKDPGMQATYPLYRGFVELSSCDAFDFILYELGYLPFFLVIEFIFRGYLLFGLHGFRDVDSREGAPGARGPLLFGNYAILISMLAYTAWHLGKPVPELFGTLVWGVAAGAIALATGTIWHLVIVHWLLNVFLDLMIWIGT